MVHAFKYAFDGCFNHQRVRRQRLGNPIVDAGMAAGRFRNFHGNIAACVSSGREKIWMNRNVACSSLDQPREPFGNVRMFNLEEGRFDQRKAAAFANAPAPPLAHLRLLPRDDCRDQRPERHADVSSFMRPPPIPGLSVRAQ